MKYKRLSAAEIKELEEIAKGLKVTDRALLKKKVKALAKEFTPKVITNSVTSSFEKTRKKYNESIDKEVEKRANLIPDVSHEARYHILRERGIVPRKENRSIKEIVTNPTGVMIKSPELKLKDLTKYMKSAMRKTNQKQKFLRSKEALIRASNFNYADKSAAAIKARIDKMTREEWELLNVEHSDLIGQLYATYHDETTAGFQPSLGYFSVLDELQRMMGLAVEQVHKEYLKNRREKRAASGKMRRSSSARSKRSRK